MPRLTFHLKKRADATAQLVLIREDGTYTAGSVGPADGYGPVHDLTHYAIEQTLGLDEGFLGLCSSGWEISDFEVKGTAARLPLQAGFAEVAAGELSRQLLTQQVSPFEDFLWAIDISMRQEPGTFTRNLMNQSQFTAIIAMIAEHWKRWRDLAPNGTLELTFTSQHASRCPAPTPAERKAGRLART